MTCRNACNQGFFSFFFFLMNYGSLYNSNKIKYFHFFMLHTYFLYMYVYFFNIFLFSCLHTYFFLIWTGYYKWLSESFFFVLVLFCFYNFVSLLAVVEKLKYFKICGFFRFFFSLNERHIACMYSVYRSIAQYKKFSW